MALRILVAGTTPESLAEIAQSVGSSFQEAFVQTAVLPNLPLESGWREPFDAAVCRADDDAQLDRLRRLRDKQQDLPLLLVSQNQSLEFQERAASAGVVSFVPLSRGAAAVAENLRLFLDMRIATDALARTVQRSKTLQEELGAQVTQSRARRRGSARFLPLIIEHDPNQAFRMILAMERADVHAPLAILKSPADARAYLSGSPPYADRSRYFMPTAIVIDPRPDDPEAPELARWVRGIPALRHLTIIVITDEARVEEVREQFGFLANSYVAKPPAFEALVETLKAIDFYWSSFNTIPDGR